MCSRRRSLLGGSKVKGKVALLLAAAVVQAFAVAAYAVEMSGVVTAVDLQRNILALKAGKGDVRLDCEAVSLKGIKAGDSVTVRYREEGGRKIVTEVVRMAPVKEEAPIPYEPPSY